MPWTNPGAAPCSAFSLALALALALSACGPLGLEGASCAHGPCAIGLTCVEEICAKVEPPTPPPPPCEADGDCVLDGSADGRVCLDDGTCAYADCAFDVQCGVRICENGQCDDRELCLNDESCGEGRVCVGNACRNACVSDEECPSLGNVALAACVNGECVQRCLGDFLCLTGICEENLCVAPDCDVDDDCDDEGPGNYFCDDTGRCIQFTPCPNGDDDDCFDPNFFCNDLGRCEERAACIVDAECGAGLCRDNHCRDASSCNVAEGCGDDALECIAGRCVDVPFCRGDDDCDGGDICVRATCDEPPAAVEPASVVVRTPFGACVDECDVTCAAPLTLRAQGYDEDGLPIRSTLDGDIAVPCDASGDVVVGPVTIRVHAIAAPADDLVVVVTDDAGVPVAGALVFVDDDTAGATDAEGVFGVSPFAEGAVGVRSQGRGVIVLDAAPGVLFVTLRSTFVSPPATDDTDGGAAGFRARVNGTGDELGDVGVGLALPSTSHVFAASADALFGSAFGGTVELPILGAIPLDLPAAMTLDATLLVVGAQEVKELAFVTSVPGPGAFLALEGRFEQQMLFDIALSADPVEVGLDVAALAEGMDALVFGAGALEALPLVEDATDVDGDGDIAERVPDFAAFPEVEAEPDTSPIERIGLVASLPPDGANQRMLAVCGLELPHGFLPLGVTSLFGSNDGEQVKIVPPPPVDAPRACVVHALLAGSTSAAVVRGDAFAALLDAGELLAPPAGAFLLEGVPTADRTSIVVPESPGADALVVTLVDDDDTIWDVIANARGSLALPTYVVPGSLRETRAYVLGSDVARTLDGPRALDDVARAVAVAP